MDVLKKVSTYCNGNPVRLNKKNVKKSTRFFTPSFLGIRSCLQPIKHVKSCNAGGYPFESLQRPLQVCMHCMLFSHFFTNTKDV